MRLESIKKTYRFAGCWFPSQPVCVCVDCVGDVTAPWVPSSLSQTHTNAVGQQQQQTLSAALSVRSGGGGQHRL